MRYGNGEPCVVLSALVEFRGKGRAGWRKARFIYLHKFEFAAPELQGM